MNNPRAPVRRRLTPDARRAQIIESATAVWSRAGARRTTVRDIANEAGVTEHFIYQLFDSREQLFKLAITDHLDSSLEMLASRLRTLAEQAEFDRPVELMRKLHAVFLSDIRGMIPLLSAAQFADPVKGPRFYSEKLYPAMRRGVSSLLQGLTRFSPRSNEMDIAIRALIGAHFAVALESVLDDQQIDVCKVANELTEMFGHGFLRGTRHLDAAQSRRIASQRRIKLAVPVKPGSRQALGNETAPRKQLARADRIVVVTAAARQIFLTHGLRGARSRQIAERAGITEVFMFRLFDSKEQLYDVAILQPLAAAFSRFAERIETLGRGAAGPAFLPEFIRIAIPFFTENGPLCMGALFAELGEGQKYFRQALMPNLRRIENVLARYLKQRGQTIDPQTARRTIFGAHWAITFDSVHRSYDVDSERTVAILAQLLEGSLKEFNPPCTPATRPQKPKSLNEG